MNITVRTNRNGEKVIDIHCHILPELDDGPQRMEISLAMASKAAQDGIRVIIATPHTDGTTVNSITVAAKVSELNNELTQHSIPLEVVAGYEIPYHLVADLATTHTLSESNYVLIEFPHTYVPKDAISTIYNLIAQGLQPIIAHPERNAAVLAQPDLMTELIEAGALSQLTAVSITGELGPDLQRCAIYLLKNSMAHFIATDSHSPNFRSPVLRKAHTFVTKLLDRKQADLLIIDNPAKILQDRQLFSEPS